MVVVQCIAILLQLYILVLESDESFEGWYLICWWTAKIQGSFIYKLLHEFARFLSLKSQKSLSLESIWGLRNRVFYVQYNILKRRTINSKIQINRG